MNERKNYRHFAGAFAVAFLLSVTATAISAAPTVSITASVSADSAMVGDALALDVVIAGVPKGAVIAAPETGKGFGDFSVLSWEDMSAQKASAKDRGKGGNRDSSQYRYRYDIAAYKPQNCTIPSIRFLVCSGGIVTSGINTNGTDNIGIDNGADTGGGTFGVNGGADSCDTLLTAPIPIRMLSALPSAPDSGGFALKDLKAQQKTGKADLWYYWAVLAAVLAVAAFLFLRKYLKKKGGAEPTVCLLPPYDEAIGAIEALEGKKYLDRGMVREYVFELSEIFKRYIGRRYGTIAPELTTEEIAAWLEFSEISREMRLCAERFFRSADQVKFAKWKPDSQCVDGYMKDVRTFIEATKPATALPYERKTERMEAAQ